MFLELPPLWIVLLNVIGIPSVHLLIAWWSTRLPAQRFQTNSFLYQSRAWENDGKTYERLFRVRQWKDRIPDGASWFSGFAKNSLQSRDSEYLKEFQVETCRGEFSHWIQMLVISFFIILEPLPRQPHHPHLRHPLQPPLHHLPKTYPSSNF